MSLGTITILDELDTSNGGPKHVRFSFAGDGAYPAGGSVGLAAALQKAMKSDVEPFTASGSGPNGDIVLEYTPLGALKDVLAPAASPCLFTTADGTAHGLSSGDVIYFFEDETANTASPPVAPAGLAGVVLPPARGLGGATPYFVLASGLTTTAFKVSLTSGGAAINTTTAPLGELSFRKADKLLVRVMDTGVESGVADQSGTTYTMAAVLR